MNSVEGEGEAESCLQRAFYRYERRAFYRYELYTQVFGERAAREEETAEDGKMDGLAAQSATESALEENRCERGSQAASMTVAGPPREEPVSTHELL